MSYTRASAISFDNFWTSFSKISFRITRLLLWVRFFCNSKLVNVFNRLLDWINLFFGFHFKVTGPWETLPTYICLFILLRNMAEPVRFFSQSPRVLTIALFFLFKGLFRVKRFLVNRVVFISELFLCFFPKAWPIAHGAPRTHGLAAGAPNIWWCLASLPAIHEHFIHWAFIHPDFLAISVLVDNDHMRNFNTFISEVDRW